LPKDVSVSIEVEDIGASAVASVIMRGVLGAI
jgi:hypothetical protein